jgi:hypothetical protein
LEERKAELSKELKETDLPALILANFFYYHGLLGTSTPEVPLAPVRANQLTRIDLTSKRMVPTSVSLHRYGKIAFSFKNYSLFWFIQEFQ